MHYSLLAYNKDRDIFDNIMESNDKKELEKLAISLVPKMEKDELRDDIGEPYDWLEIWDEKENIRLSVY